MVAESVIFDASAPAGIVADYFSDHDLIVTIADDRYLLVSAPNTESVLRLINSDGWGWIHNGKWGRDASAAVRSLKMSKVKLTNEQLDSMTPWQIAEHYGIGYSGDMNPINHGGFFYSLNDWEAYGYASCVEFWELPDCKDDTLIVQRGTIHKLDDMEGAFDCCGVGPDNPDRSNIHLQIDCVKSYCGMEPDGIEYPDLKSFKLKDWKERNIWKSIRNWIEELAGG